MTPHSLSPSLLVVVPPSEPLPAWMGRAGPSGRTSSCGSACLDDTAAQQTRRCEARFTWILGIGATLHGGVKSRAAQNIALAQQYITVVRLLIKLDIEALRLLPIS